MTIYIAMTIVILMMIVSCIMVYLLTKPLSQSHELFNGYYPNLLQKFKLFGLFIGMTLIILMLILAFGVVLKCFGV